MKIKPILILLFLIPVLSYSQKIHYAEIRLNGGFIAPHRIGMDDLSDKPSRGIELTTYYDFGKSNYYDAKYNSPYTGFGFSWQNLGNKETLGQSFAIFSFMELKLVEFNQFSFNSRINGGLTYITEKYDQITNPENIAIGTNVNFYFKLDLGLEYSFTDKPLSIKFKPSLIHFSNGSVYKPNLGLNQINFTFGFAYKLNDIDRGNNIDYTQEKPQKKHEYTLMGTYVTSDEYSVQPDGRGGGFKCSTVALGYNYIYSKIGKIGISSDIFYNENLYFWYDGQNQFLHRVNETPEEIIRAGLSFGHELIYKKISLLTYVGFYYRKKVKPNELIYSRFGLRYYLFNNMFLNATIKAYGFKAHYIECGIGFSLKK